MIMFFHPSWADWQEIGDFGEPIGVTVKRMVASGQAVYTKTLTEEDAAKLFKAGPPMETDPGSNSNKASLGVSPSSYRASSEKPETFF